MQETKEKNLSGVLAEFLWDLRYEDIPKETVSYTKLLLLDYFASSAAGYKVNAKTNAAIHEVVKNLGGTEQGFVLFDKTMYPAPHAAFINAAYTHGADMDDGHRVMGGHPGGPVISAVLATAGTLDNVSGKEILTAIVCGYEAMIRIGAAVQPDHVGRGFHSTGTTGSIGAAVASAKLIAGDYHEFFNAMSLSTVQASGLMSVTESAQSAKPLNAARAAYTGMLCALFAVNGIAAPDDPLESPKGFFHAFGDNIRREAITDELGKRFEICGCYIKPYPTCRATHPGAEAMIALRDQIKNSRQIREIRLNIYPRAIFIAGDRKNHIPDEPERCKFSLAYAIACAYHNGNIRVEEDIIQFSTEKAKDVLETCAKVKLVEDPSTEDVLHGKRGCRLEVELLNGEVLEKTVIIPKGDPEVPMTFEDCRAKLDACSTDILSDEQRNWLYHSILTLDEEEQYQDLIAPLH